MKENENKPRSLTEVTDTGGRRTMGWNGLGISREERRFGRGNLGGVAGI